MSLSRISRIILLSGEPEVGILSAILRQENPGVEIQPVYDRDAVAAACTACGPWTRLISFCTSVIVPGAALQALPGPGYNFHPGPPTRPGRYPSVFAIYEADRRFGITVHEMAAKVDSGPIVATDLFDMPRDCDLAALESLTFHRMVDIFRSLAPHLAKVAEPLPHLPVSWSGAKTTLAQVNALARIDRDMSAEEVARRRLAFGGHVILVEDP